MEDIDRETILDLFIYEPLKDFKYSSWNNVRIQSPCLSEEIKRNSRKFLDFIEVLNPQLLKSKHIRKLELLLQEMNL